jgi:hypothetical protein
MRLVALAFSLTLLTACGSDDGAPTDAGPDVGFDARVDATADGARPDTDSTPVPDSAADAPAVVDVGSDVAVPDSATPGLTLLVSEAGCFFTPDETDRVRTFPIAGGTTYERLEIAFSVVAGPFQPHIPDPSNRTEHILLDLSRAGRPRSFERYLMGVAAVDFVSRPSHFRMFGREEIAMGYMSYTQVSGVYDGWTEGVRYDIACSIDASTHLQECTLSVDGTVVATRMLAVDYLDAALHMNTGFNVSVGADHPIDHDHLQTPQGWLFCDLTVHGRAL